MTTTTKTIADIDKLSASQLLAIPADEPGHVFSGTLDALKSEHRLLVKRWHPDLNKDARARDVFEHLTKLYQRAEAMIKAGAWQIPGRLNLTGTDGKTYALNYKKRAPFEYGDCFISRGLVTYLFRAEFKAQYEQTLKNIRDLKFGDERLRKEFARTLPQVEKAFATKDGFALLLKKEPEMVRLRDLLDHSGGTLDPRHVAWILSTLHNLSCYLALNGLTHNDIGPDTYFVGPKGHTGALIGGWAYALPAGAKISSLPDRTYDAAAADILRAGKADARVDLGLIRLTGRELLGDPKGLSLHRKKEIPKPLSTWLRMPTSGDARADYKAWETNTLPESFGARRYTEMKTTFSDIYEKGEKPWVPPSTSTSASTARPAPR